MKKAPMGFGAERAPRTALSQKDFDIGCAKGPVSSKNAKTWVVEKTVCLLRRI